MDGFWSIFSPFRSSEFVPPCEQQPRATAPATGPLSAMSRWGPVWEPWLGAARDTQHFKGPAAGRPDPAQRFASHGAGRAAARRVPRCRERLRCEPSASRQGNTRARSRPAALQRGPVPWWGSAIGMARGARDPPSWGMEDFCSSAKPTGAAALVTPRCRRGLILPRPRLPAQRLPRRTQTVGLGVLKPASTSPLRCHHCQSALPLHRLPAGAAAVEQPRGLSRRCGPPVLPAALAGDGRWAEQRWAVGLHQHSP